MVDKHNEEVSEQETSTPVTKKDELITDKSIEDPTTSSNEAEKEEGTNAGAAFLPIGMSMGIVLGLVMDNLALGISLGAALGIILMVVLNKKSQ